MTDVHIIYIYNINSHQLDLGPVSLYIFIFAHLSRLVILIDGRIRFKTAKRRYFQAINHQNPLRKKQIHMGPLKASHIWR